MLEDAHWADAATATLLAGARPTAIVYANDPMAISGIGVLQEAGLEVPRDVSVAGFDGSPGIVRISPTSGVMKPAPADRLYSGLSGVTGGFLLNTWSTPPAALP